MSWARYVKYQIIENVPSHRMPSDVNRVLLTVEHSFLGIKFKRTYLRQLTGNKERYWWTEIHTGSDVSLKQDSILTSIFEAAIVLEKA